LANPLLNTTTSPGLELDAKIEGLIGERQDDPLG
jgi:hypothetical protein